MNAFLAKPREWLTTAKHYHKCLNVYPYERSSFMHHFMVAIAMDLSKLHFLQMFTPLL